MTQAYWDNLRQSFRNELGQWDIRPVSCAYRLISAVSFRETSLATFEKTDTPLLSIIGYYYGMFHMGIAILSVEQTTHTDELARMRHNKLRNLLNSKLVDRSLLPEHFVELLWDLQTIREHSNYRFDRLPKHRDGSRLHLRHEVGAMYKKTGEAYDVALSFIKRVLEEVGDYRLGTRIIGLISDGISDDLFDVYLSVNEESRVNDYLLSVGFAH